jgi:CRISPR-associated protein Cmr6
MPSDLSVLGAMIARQGAVAAPLAADGRLLTLDARATAPFTTGLGNEHPLENGFAFLNPYGLPYLPGSGVKGVLRQAARELESGRWGDKEGWTEHAITHLFGLDSEDRGKEHRRGALTFWDVLPQLEGDTLHVDVMTPHQSHYYQPGKEIVPPHDSGQPIPIPFLTVPPSSRFTFHVQCDLRLLRRRDESLAAADRWQALMQAAFRHAFEWLGFGAKTAVGYGAMAPDPAARQKRESEAAAQRSRAHAEAEAARLDALTPEDRQFEEAKAAVDKFREALAKAKAAGSYNPGGPFNQERLAFVKTALSWTDTRGRAAAADALAESATKAWGRPSNKERWAELQKAIADLKGGA